MLAKYFRSSLAVCCMALLSVVPGSSRAGQPAPPVPPTQEIVVLDPNANSTGKPAVQLKVNPVTGSQEVEIPPVVIVHNFYYTGDRWFQGPMLPGGSSILVVNHPSTGQRCYIPAQMLPGAPVIRYSARSIEYDYGCSDDSCCGSGRKRTPASGMSSNSGTPRLVREAFKATW